MAHSKNLMTALHELRTAASDARDTGAHTTALAEGRCYFPEIEEEALLREIAIDEATPSKERNRLRFALKIASNCHFWNRIDDDSIRRVLAASSILIAHLREAKSVKEHAKLVRWCTNLQGACNSMRRRLARDLKPFSREGYEAMSLEELRAEHKRLLEADIGLKSLLEAEQAQSSDRRPATVFRVNGRRVLVANQVAN